MYSIRQSDNKIQFFVEQQIGNEKKIVFVAYSKKRAEDYIKISLSLDKKTAA